MTALDPILTKLGIAEAPELRGGALWINPGSCGLRDVALAMKEAGARFVTITAYQLPGDSGFRLEYHWDLSGQLLGVPFATTPGPNGPAIDSIFDISEAVIWIEREIHEEYVIDFTGRPYEPLLLKPGATLGINLREEAAK
jgi:NADH:ubiquinone oxidoreductase subunit C